MPTLLVERTFVLDTERWSYLFLGLGVFAGRAWQPPNPSWRPANPSVGRSPRAWTWAAGWPSLHARVVPFRFTRHPFLIDGMTVMAPGEPGVVQLALSFEDWHADDALASQIAEALWVLHALVVGSMARHTGDYGIPGSR